MLGLALIDGSSSSVLHAASSLPVRRFWSARAINKLPGRVNIMADEDEEQARALAAPLLEDATEAPVNEAPEQSAAEAPEQTPEEPDEGRSTILGVGINLANAIVGSGIVGLPERSRTQGSASAASYW